jgi:hypothetical protein
VPSCLACSGFPIKISYVFAVLLANSFHLFLFIHCNETES